MIPVPMEASNPDATTDAAKLATAVAAEVGASVAMVDGAITEFVLNGATDNELESKSRNLEARVIADVMCIAALAAIDGSRHGFAS